MAFRQFTSAALIAAGMTVAHTRAGAQMHMPTSPFGIPMDRMASGTTWIPDAVRMPSFSRMLGEWDLMLHGFVFAQYDKQSGKRGDDQFGSLNWGMLMLGHDLLGGRFQARTMLSLDPATVSSRGYPLLLQSGELYKGDAIVDRQHPHDFIMELGVLYERALLGPVGVSLYAAPSGEPALGPVAFMHRPSAMDSPFAPLGHHWQDATHISFGVATAGLFGRRWKIEASAFNGREPDDRRWNFDKLTLDSYSARVTINPTSHWSATAGYGFLASPEALESERSAHRITASLMHGAAIGERGQVATTFIWGANRESGEGSFTHSVLAESEAILDARNTILARAEHVEKHGEDLGVLRENRVNMKAVSLGYIREMKESRGVTIGIGAEGTVNFVDARLRSAYGSRTPLGGMVFVRLRPSLKGGGMAGMHHMN